MIGWIGVILIGLAVLIFACCKASGDYDRAEEKEDPCGTCLRWSECNGVDGGCPVRKEKSDG